MPARAGLYVPELGLRAGRPERLDNWLTDARGWGLTTLVRFAQGLEQNLAALALPWSNAQAEDQINCFKSIKRQMLGRAGFEVLRACVMPLPS